jgi:hypothetical protein
MVPQDPKGIVKPTLLCLSLCAKWDVEQHRVTKKKKNQTQISHAKLNKFAANEKTNATGCCQSMQQESAKWKMQISSPLTLHINI